MRPGWVGAEVREAGPGEPRGRAEALLRQAHAAAIRGDAARAVALAEDACDLAPADPRGPLKLADVHYALTGDDAAGLTAVAEAQRRGAGPAGDQLAGLLTERQTHRSAIAALYPELAAILSAPERPRRPARRGRLRVAHVVHRWGVGGIERWMANLLRYLDDSQCERFLVLLTDPGPNPGYLFCEAQASGATPRIWPVVDAAGRLDASAFRALVAFLETCDVAHTQYAGFDTLPYLSALLARVPVLVETVQYLGSSLARQADAIICPSHALFMRQAAKERAILVPLGIDLARFHPNRPATLGLPRPVVGCVCTLAAHKDPVTFVEAAALVSRVRPGVRFVMVGDGPMRTQLEALARARDVSVTFTGRRDDVEGVLQGMDIFAYTPLIESFGLAPIEAMAMGLPVVCAPLGGLRDFVVDGQNGLLVPPRDPHALAAAIVSLLDDPPLRERMGRVGRRWAETRFSAEVLAARHVELYRALADQTRQGKGSWLPDLPPAA